MYEVTLTEEELRQQIIEAGLRLKEEGLIARTWGNISARLNNKEFLITPSGLAYEDIKPEDIVKLSIQNPVWDGITRKPSSEKGIHAAAYALKEDVNFVIHTHQFYASAVCAEEEDVTLPGGSFVPCAKYALPGTDKLCRYVTYAMAKNTGCYSYLLAKHGALCLGTDYSDAFSKAAALERGCKALFKERVSVIIPPVHLKPYIDDYAQIVPAGDNPDDPEAVKMITEKNVAAALYVRNAGPIPFYEAALQHFIYVSKYSKLRNKH